MTYFDAVVLGLVQGLTEFLPVSSSGHLVIAQQLLHVSEPGVFLEVTLHVGTLLSVLIVYRRKLASLVIGLIRRDPDALRYIALLVLASVPAAIVGFTLQDTIEAAFKAPVITGIMLIVTGGILWSTRYVEKERPAARSVPGWGLAFAIGVAQSFAILPGISRSGSTIATGLWGGLRGAAAAEFSFLMSVPAIAGAALLQTKDVGADVATIGVGHLIVGFLTSLIAGIIAIEALVWLLRKQEFHRFAYYLWPVGLLFLAWIMIGR